MSALRAGLCAILLLLLSVPLFAQLPPGDAPAEQKAQEPGESDVSQPAPAASEQAGAAARTSRAGRRGARPVPCWRVAGIAPAAVNQRWQIEETGKGKISQVCSDNSLSAEQKRDRIHQINEQTEQEISKIIPAKQLEAFKSCQAERDQEAAKHPGKTPQKQLGPCGGVIPPQPVPGHTHGQPANPPSQ